MKIKKVTPAFLAEHEKKHGGVIYIKTKPAEEPPKGKVLKIETELLVHDDDDDAMTLRNNEIVSTSEDHSPLYADDNSEDQYQNHRLSSLQ